MKWTKARIPEPQRKERTKRRSIFNFLPINASYVPLPHLQQQLAEDAGAQAPLLGLC